MGLADALVEDDARQMVEAVQSFIAKGVPAEHRSSEVALYRGRIAALDPSRQWDPKELRSTWKAGISKEDNR
jgi:malonate decarboxylase beta subunit